MTSSTNPAPGPERAPERSAHQGSPRPAWPRPEKKPAKFTIKLSGYIPS